MNSVIIRIIPAGSVRFSARATTLVFAGEDPKALPPHEYRSQGLPWEVQIFLKAPLRGVDGGGALRALVPDTPRQAALQLVGLVEANAARPRHQPRHGGGRTRAQSMLSAATKSSHQEGALGAMAATIARWQRRKDRSANFGDQLELLG